MLCRLAAANAGICEVIFNKGDAAGFYAAGDVLELFFALGLATPHCLNVALFISGSIKELFISARLIGAVGSVLKCAIVKLVVNLLQSLFNFFNEVVKGYKGLFTRYAADEHAGVVFDITRTNFETERNTLHLVLSKLPTRGVVAVVELDTQSLGKLSFDLGCLFKYALFVLRYGNDNDLNRCYARGENETVASV